MRKFSDFYPVIIAIGVVGCLVMIVVGSLKIKDNHDRAKAIALEEPTPAKHLSDRFQWQKVYGDFGKNPCTWLLTDTNTHQSWIWVEHGGVVSVPTE